MWFWSFLKKLILVFIFNVSLITSIYRMFYKWHHQYFLCYFFHFLWHIYNLYFNVFCFQWIYASLLLLFSFTNNSKWYPDSWLWCFCWSTVHLAVFFSSKRNISSHIHGFTWMSDEMFLLLKTRISLPRLLSKHQKPKVSLIFT